MTTPRLGAPELTSGQATPETTVNEQVRYIEAGAGHFIFKDRDLATPPGSPADGDCYLVAASPTGAWAGQAGKIAFRVNTAWAFITAIEGFTAWVNDENAFIGYDGATWSVLASPSGIYQPLDGDLTAISALSGTNTIYYRSAADTWSPVTIGSGLSFSAGTLAGSGGSPTTVGGNLYTLANPSAITFLRVNADNTVSALSASAFRTAIGAGSGTGDLLSTNNLSDLASPSAARTNLGLGNAATHDAATTAQVQAGTASKIVEADKLIASAAPQTLTDGATVSWDMSAGYNAKVTLGGNRTLAVSNPVAGMTYSLNVIQDATGSRTVTWPSSFDWGTTGAPTLTTTASKRDRITLFCTDAATPKFDAFLSGKGFS